MEYFTWNVEATAYGSIESRLKMFWVLHFIQIFLPKAELKLIIYSIELHHACDIQNMLANLSKIWMKNIWIWMSSVEYHLFP